jgi:hypothetical protein
MKLSEVKSKLAGLSEVNFVLPDGTKVPEHFHITEVGMIDKTFIDCGGVVRRERVANFQLWEANDFDHRLKPEKMTKIIELSEKVLALPDMEIEVEYQSSTIGKYDLDFRDGNFYLLAKQTACLASDHCGIPQEKMKVSLSSLTPAGAENSSCGPNSKCC